MISDMVTVVRSYGPVLTKRIGPDTVQSCDSAKRFDLFTRAVEGLGDLEDLLRVLKGRPDCAVVRGQIADPVRVRGVRRLLYPDPQTGEAASLREAARFWLALDYDDLATPEAFDLTDLHGCGRVARARLPVGFRHATCLVQGTGQHAVNGAHLRLWFWLSRPTADLELKTWLKSAPVDHSLFNAGQLIYTSAPLFTGGVTDPLPERIAVLFGTGDIVTVPDPDVLHPPRRHPPPSPPSDHIRASSHASIVMMTVAAAVLRAPVGQRHKTLVLGARRLAELEMAGLVSTDETELLLTKAARGCGLALERDLEGEVGRIVSWARRSSGGNDAEQG